MTLELPELKPQATTSVALHMLPFHDVATSKKPITTIDGYLVGGPDRRGANAISPAKLWSMWQRDVLSRLDSVPEAVQDYFVRTKHLTSPPKSGDSIESPGTLADYEVDPQTGYTIAEYHETEMLIGQVIDKAITLKEDTLLDLDLVPDASGAFGMPPKKKLANPPRFATSFSGMEAFLNCPYQWAANKYFKTVPFEESEAIKWGNRVHKAAENYLLNAQDGGSRPVEAECLSLVQKYCDLFLRSGATLHVEKEMCFTKELKTCGWKDRNTVWFRGKADIISVKDRKLNVYDWKTGKVKDDPFQLEVMIALADLYFGDQFDEANGKLIFLKEPDPKKALVGLHKPITKADIPAIWEKIFAITSRMEAAWENENFRMQTSGLCRQYCGALDCPHNGRRGR